MELLLLSLGLNSCDDGGTLSVLRKTEQGMDRGGWRGCAWLGGGWAAAEDSQEGPGLCGSVEGK